MVQGAFTMVQTVGPRFLDAHEIQQRDFNVVTRNFQNNNTQRWALTQVQGELHRIQQVSSGRFLDAHEIANLDYRVVTRPRQENNTQLWRLRDYGGSFFTVQQASSSSRHTFLGHRIFRPLPDRSDQETTYNCGGLINRIKHYG